MPNMLNSKIKRVCCYMDIFITVTMDLPIHIVYYILPMWCLKCLFWLNLASQFHIWFIPQPNSIRDSYMFHIKTKTFLACNQLLHCDRTCAYIVQVRKLITRLRETIKTNFQLCSRRMQPTDSQTIIVLGPNDRYSGSQPVAGKTVNNTLYGEDITHKTYLHCM